MRIAIADDHALFREGLRSLLKWRTDVSVVAEADRVEDIMPMLDRTPCDLLLLDLQMDRNALADITTFTARVPVAVVTADERPENGLAAIRAGARAVILKRFAVETLLEAVRAIAQGHVWMPPDLQTYIADGLQERAPTALTPREREIVRYVAVGLRNAEVAQRLLISEQTVKAHLNNIFQKLAVRDRVGLTLYALRAGIIGVDEQESQ